MIGSDLGVAAFGLASAASWGTSDFGGGFAARRVPAAGVVLVSQTIGLAFALALVALRSERLLSIADIGWGMAAGLSGAGALAAFYRGLAIGRMGLVAPVAGVIGASLPVVVGSAVEGLPGAPQLVGIVLALVAVVLVSRSDDRIGGRDGLGLALVAGLGFGGFFVLIRGADHAAVGWPLVGARLASVVLLAGYTLLGKRAWRPGLSLLPVLVMTGIGDVGGNLFYILAANSGKVAVAAVLSSLYPVVTVLLAFTLLHERVARVHAVGIGMAAVAIALIGAG